MIVWIFQQYFHFAVNIFKNIHNLEENVCEQHSCHSRVFPCLVQYTLYSTVQYSTLIHCILHYTLQHSDLGTESGVHTGQLYTQYFLITVQYNTIQYNKVQYTEYSTQIVHSTSDSRFLEARIHGQDFFRLGEWYGLHE